MDLLDVVFDFNRVVPGDAATVRALLALGVLNNVFETLQLLKHHRLLAIDHLSTHRVVEVGHLLQGDTLFVELLCVFCDVMDWLGNLETVLAENTSIFDKGYQLLAVVDLEETALLVVEVKLHELAGHLVLVLLIGVLQGLLDPVNPFGEQVLFEAADLFAEIRALLGEALHTAEVTEHGLSGLKVLLKLQGKLAGPNDGAHGIGDVLALRWALHARDLFEALTSTHFELLLRLLNFARELSKKILSFLLELLLNGVLAEETLPSLELSEQLARCCLSLSEDFLPELLAKLLLHGFDGTLILLHGSVPAGGLVLISVEGVNLAEGVESIGNLESVALLGSKQAQQLVVLRAQLKDDANAQDDVLEVAVVERLALPLVLFRLALPEIAR